MKNGAGVSSFYNSPKSAKLIKSLSSNKETCDKFRVRLEGTISEMLVKPSQSNSQIKKESQKALQETHSAILKRFSQARYGLSGIYNLM